MFNRNKLSAAIVTVVASLTAHNHATAQDSGIVEEVMVTGIRASLEAAMDIKRDSAGVVDAISAEDIGKFPDTNLAESMQRITGVSIDRRNGEGSSVTIRGFGGDNNMVTLNGRQMPAASAFGGGSGSGGTTGGNTRAFDFANLASESVSGVQVYKTGKASIATGGIGGTINIQTARPLDNPGLGGSVGIKAVHDTTVRVGDEVTPEVSGIFSWTDDNDMFGVALSAIYQERDSAVANAQINDWNIGRWGEGDNIYSMAADGVINNEPDDGQLYARPNDLRYAFSDNQRERVNGQLTLQYRPIEAVTLTADFTYAENNLSTHRGEQTFWFANSNSATRVDFDNSAVRTPTIYSEDLTAKDMGFEQQYREQTDTLESLGFNVEWNVNDILTMKLDVHNSVMDSKPTGPGQSGAVDISIAAPVGASQTVNFGYDLPVADFTHDDSIRAIEVVDEDRDGVNEEYPLFIDADGNPTRVDTGTPQFRGNNNGEFDVGDVGSQVARIWYAGQETEITQIKLDGTFEFDDSRFDFGIESRTMETDQKNSERYMALGDWGVAKPGEIPENLLQEFSLTDQYEDYSLDGATPLGFRGDAVALTEWALGPGGYDGELSYNPNFGTNNIIEENILAGYVQFGYRGELAGMETNLLAGFRYETTDVESSSLVSRPLYLLWQDNNDFTTIRSNDVDPIVAPDTSYDHLLPSFDFDISFSEDLVGRFSYSKTIARPGYGNLAAAASNFGTVGSTYLGTTPTANIGNPALVPLESDNVDVSLEWYYDDTSYASVGVFEKRVNNFIGSEQEMQNHYGMLDVTNGELVEQAYAALEAGGYEINDTSLFTMSAVLANPDDFPTGATAYDPGTQFTNDVAFNYDLVPEAGRDPEMMFRTATPINNREAKLYGAEFAVQHFFADTGFGVQANYTIVRGDVSFDDLEDPSVSQFALVGLSDTANLVGIYEKDAISARIAYNWRDQFLNETNRGNSRNPVYVEAFASVDMNVAYEFNDQMSVFLEGINLTGENVRQFGRSKSQMWYLEDLGARFNLGARYTF